MHIAIKIADNPPPPPKKGGGGVHAPSAYESYQGIIIYFEHIIIIMYM